VKKNKESVDPSEACADATELAGKTSTQLAPSVSEVADILVRRYRPWPDESAGPVIDQLVWFLLSTRTTVENCNAAYAALRGCFSGWDEVAEAGEEALYAHIWRVTRRLGWHNFPGETPSRRGADHLNALMPAGLDVLSLHVNLIRLGREFCPAGKPRCGECPLGAICATAATKRPGTSARHALDQVHGFKKSRPEL